MYFAAGSVLPNSPLEIIYFHYSALFFQYFCDFSVSCSSCDFVCLPSFGRQLLYREFYVFSYTKHIEI